MQVYRKVWVKKTPSTNQIKISKGHKKPSNVGWSTSQPVTLCRVLLLSLLRVSLLQCLHGRFTECHPSAIKCYSYEYPHFTIFCKNYKNRPAMGFACSVGPLYYLTANRRRRSCPYITRKLTKILSLTSKCLTSDRRHCGLLAGYLRYW